MLRFSPHVLGASPYLPEWPGLDRDKFIALDRNESTRPLSPVVVEAIAAHVRDTGVRAYPTTERLVGPLARYCGVAPECVLPTSGANQAIQIVLRSFVGAGHKVLMAAPAFPYFAHMISTLGASVHSVPFDRDMTFPYREFREAARTTGAQLFVVINPNNPTGSPVDPTFIAELAATHPEVPVLVDEAYYEYTGVTSVPLTQERENVLVLRSFSKAFAMAGLRLGYLVAAGEVVTHVGKLRNPFDVNAIAVLAGQEQLRRPDEMRRHVLRTMRDVKPVVTGFLADRGVPHWPGAANFLLVGPDPEAPEQPAAEYLRDCGILVRPMSGPPLAGCLRVSVGTSVEMAAFCTAFGRYLDGKPAAPAATVG